MFRVLFFAELNPNKFGSLEEMVLFLGRELSIRGNELILAVTAIPVPEVAELFSNAGIKVVSINSSSKLQKESTVFQRICFIRKLVIEQNVDLIHINFFRLTNQVVLGAYLSNATILFTEHTSGVAPVRGLIKGWLSKCLHFFIALRVKKYIAVSKFVGNRLRTSHHIGPEKSVTIYNGVNIQRFAPLDKINARHMTGLPRDRKIILSVAMLIPEKGIQYLIHAAYLLVTKFKVSDIYIVIAGEGHFQEDLEKQVKSLLLTEQVIFLGQRSDVNLLVAAADVVAVPAVWAESFGLIIAEAMASGRPVVASRIGGIPELIENDITGTLVVPGDSAGLASAIYNLLDNPTQRELIAAAALHKARQQFDLSHQVAKLVNLYEQVGSG
jgi:glycosyltransferase involved in cell wall biosynthesis